MQDSGSGGGGIEGARAPQAVLGFCEETKMEQPLGEARDARLAAARAGEENAAGLCCCCCCWLQCGAAQREGWVDPQGDAGPCQASATRLPAPAPLLL